MNIYWKAIIKKNKWTGRLVPVTMGKEEKGEKIISTPKINNFKLIGTQIKKERNYNIVFSGRLSGVSKARTMTIRKGALKPQTITSKVNHYQRPIYTKYGIIGIKVSVI